MKLSFLKLLCVMGLPLMLGVSCISVEEDAKGFAGEFCTINDHCQSNVCDNRVCTSKLTVDLSTSEGRNCDDICTYLKDSCNSNDASCYLSCVGIIKDWREQAQKDFSDCFRGQGSIGISCDQATRDDAPNVCYNKLPLAADRQNRCDSFVSKARFNTSGRDEDFVELRKKCQQIGRVFPDTEWDKTAGCANTDLNTEQFVTCLNTVFVLSPPLVVSP